MKKTKFLKVFKNQKGFTLVELLIYIGIFSILILVLFQLLSLIFDVQLESQSSSSVTQDSRFIINRLSYDLGQAEVVTVPDFLASASSTLQFSKNNTAYTYSLQNGKITLTNSGQGTIDELNSHNTTVSNLIFTRLSDSESENSTVTMSFTLTSTIIKRGEVASEDFTITVGTR